MKFHKTILTMLAVTLAIIGTTGTVVQADGPPVQVPENLNPENVLSGTDLANWNALTSSNKTLLSQEVIPEIPDKVQDTSLHAHFVASLVRSMHRIQLRQGTVSQDHDADQDPCGFDVDANIAGASALMACPGHQMALLKAKVELWLLNSDSLGDDENECRNCSAEWAVVSYLNSSPPGCTAVYAAGTGRAEGNTGGTQPGQYTYGPYDDYYCYGNE